MKKKITLQPKSKKQNVFRQKYSKIPATTEAIHLIKTTIYTEKYTSEPFWGAFYSVEFKELIKSLENVGTKRHVIKF